MPESSALPHFLRSFDDLTTHFDEHFGPLGSNQRGDTFLELARNLIPLTQECQGFPRPEVSERKSHDEGVDLLTSETDDGRILCVQSKYKITDKSVLDSIISKFHNFETKLRPDVREPELFETPKQQTAPVPTFAVITSSKLETIRRRYESSSFTSRAYCADLLRDGRLIFIDGPRILSLLQQLYRKAHQLPANVSLRSRSGWIHVNGVHLGVVRGGRSRTTFRRARRRVVLREHPRFPGRHERQGCHRPHDRQPRDHPDDQRSAGENATA